MKYKIYLDFDGTVVEHAYPDIGRCNFGCVEVIQKLQQAGHEIVLNTMRCEFNDGSLEKAIEWFDKAWMFVTDKSKRDDFSLLPIPATTFKHSPFVWNWWLFEQDHIIVIDDLTKDIPLKPCAMTNGYMVDWEELDKQFIQKGIYGSN